MGPEPVIAIAGSQRAWAAELVRFLSDFGGARFVGTVLTAREALESVYEVLLIDDITSYLSPRLVERVRESGRKVVGVYDPESGDRGRKRLRTLGVAAAIPANTDPEAILETITAIGFDRSAGNGEDVAHGPESDLPLRVTAVAGGDLAGDVVYVAEPTPVGLSRALRWIAQARSLTAARLHIVFGGVATSSFQRGELSDELTRSYLPSSITWLPVDQGRDRAVWNGTAIPRGPFIKTVLRLGATILDGHAGEPE